MCGLYLLATTNLFGSQFFEMPRHEAVKALDVDKASWPAGEWELLFYLSLNLLIFIKEWNPWTSDVGCKPF